MKLELGENLATIIIIIVIVIATAVILMECGVPW